MRIERTANATRNIIWGGFSKIVAMLLPFMARTILLHLLGEKYLGLNGLFSSIIQVLNLADLGFGIAIAHSMYKPIAEDDNDTICALLAFYKKVYAIIGTIVLIGGMALLPFIKNLVSGEIPEDVNIYIIYLIYLFNTAISYWLFAYKSSLLSAHQRNDITNKISTIVMFLQYTLQIGLLFIIKNYYIYLLVMPFVTFIQNVLIACFVNKLFPQYICKGNLNSKIKNRIKKQVGALFLSKICGTTRNSLDSIFISMYRGLRDVAIYGNYYYILNAVHGLLGVANTSIVGGIGNSIEMDSVDKNYKDFIKITFVYSWIAGWCSCCMLCLYQHFMRIWVGENLLFPKETMILFCVYFFFVTMSDVKNTYTDACGLWTENRVRSVLEACINLFLNIVLGYLWGVNGVIVATLITMIFINVIYGTQILFKYYFKKQKVYKIFLKYAFYTLVTAFVSGVTFAICECLPETGFLNLIIKSLICIVLPNILFFICYFKTNDFILAKGLVISAFKKIFKSFHN